MSAPSVHLLDPRKRAPGPKGETGAETGANVKEAPEKLYCARCGHLVTEGRWRMAKKGGHDHTVFNPAGIVFEIRCFRDAPGAAPAGAPSGDFTWFKGYVWRVAACRGCGVHLGWMFEGTDESPPVFFGLIANRLTSRAAGSGRA